MGRYNIVLDKPHGPPPPGEYFCTTCNTRQIILVKGQELKPCPKCKGHDFSTV